MVEGIGLYHNERWIVAVDRRRENADGVNADPA